MSLATRCTSCGTIFRVVQDQLKVSEGWVRCGRCQEVFSALEGLFDLEREAPPQRVDNQPSATQVAAQGVADFVASHHPLPTDFDPEPGGAADEHTVPVDEAHGFIEPPAAPQAELSPWPESQPVRPDDEFAALREASFSPDAPAEERDDDAIERDSSLLQRWRDRRDEKHAALASSMLEPTMGEAPAAPADFDAGLDATDAPTPGFLSPAAAPPSRWDHPGARAGLSVVAVVLVAGLLGQVALQFRDVFAAQWPQSRSSLQALCEWTGCRIEPLRRLAAVTVEASGLTQVQGSDAYRLSVNLHNRSAFEVALPSIDLSLTDGSGALVARRALAPSDFSGAPALATGGSSVVTLAPGAEAQLQALLASRGARISGYTVELFYP